MIKDIRILIEKFWANQLSEKDAVKLDNLINEHDSEFRNELELEFYHLVDLKEKSKIKNHTGLGKIISIGYRFKWGVAAAALILLFLSVQLFEHKKTAIIVQTKNHSFAKTSIQKNDFTEIKNSTQIDLPINLPDGSYVTLAPKSMISYERDFNVKKRNIKLIGKAVFKVAKNKNRPFSVLTHGYATTALGTEFEVNTFEKNKILVKLFEGKVKVYSLENDSQFETVYLTHGESLSIDKIHKLEHFLVKTSPNKTIESKLENQLTQLSFDHESLKEVFDKLSSTFKINLVYDAKDIEGLYFTGHLLESDTIKSILILIANMNNLEITEVQSGFQVVKK